MNPILIHKSDSTIFANVNKFLTFNLETDLDLTGWQAKFILGWVEKTIDDISLKSFEIILGAEDTKQLRLGKQYGTIILTDSNGNIKTVTNTIPFEVTTAVVENEYQEIDLTIPESSGVDIRLKVGASTVTSVNGMTGDVVIKIPDVSNLATKEEIPSLDGYVKDTDYANASKAGVIGVGTYYACGATQTGYLYAITQTLDKYNSVNTNSFISKGTLENIKDDYIKRALTQNTMELTEEDKASTKQLLGYATPTDIMQAIASIPQFKLSIVDELPLAGEKMTLYLVPKEGTNNDVYDEYIWIEQTESFEHLGTTAVDLTDYVKKTDYAGDVGGVIKISSVNGLAKASNGYLLSVQKTLEDYNSGANNMFVSKGTLENIKNDLVKRAVTENDIELTDDEKTSARTWLGAVGNTDYATADKAGVVRVSSYYSTAMSSSNGFLIASTKTLQAYTSLDKASFISKGTLDNVLTQYSKTVLTTEADYNALEIKDANTLYLIEE